MGEKTITMSGENNTDNSDVPVRAYGNPRAHVAEQPDSPTYNPPSPSEQPYQLQSPPSEFRAPSRGSDRSGDIQYEIPDYSQIRNPLRTVVPPLPVESIESGDVLKTNKLSKEDEIKFMSSRKGTDPALKDGSKFYKESIDSEKQLVEYISSHSFIRPQYVGDSGLFINKEQAIDSSVFDRFRESNFYQFLPEDFVVNSGRSIANLKFPIEIELLNTLGLPYNENERNSYTDMESIPTMFKLSSDYREAVRLKSRSSMEHYPSYVSALALSKVTGSIDASTTRAWQSNFQLRNEEDATWLIKNRARTASVGDNHLYLLVRALCYYMDSMWSQAKNVVVHTRKQPVAGHTYSIYHDPNWVSSVAEGGKEVVNCTDMDADYSYFWTCCCLPVPEVLSSMTAQDGAMVTSPYGSLITQMNTPMCCVSDHRIMHPRRAPTWFTQPQYMLSYIETYVDKFGLQQQLSEAYSIVQYLPIAKHMGLNVSLPEPIHASDWYENQVEAHETTSCTIALAGSHPMQLVSSVSIMPLVIRCSLYDLSCAIIKTRKQITPKKEEKLYINQFWKRALSRGGSAMTFIFNRILRAPLKAAHLCGWTRHIVDITPMLPKSWDDIREYPLCVQMLQSVTSQSSVRSHFVEGAEFSFNPSVMNNLAVLDMQSLQKSWVLGLIKESEMDTRDSNRLKPIVPQLEFNSSITFRASNRTLNWLLSSKSDRISITFRPPYSLADDVAKVMIDPLDSDTIDNVWGFGGLETPDTLLSRGGQFDRQVMDKVLDDRSRISETAGDISDSILSNIVEKVEADINERSAELSHKAFNWVTAHTSTLQNNIYEQEANALFPVQTQGSGDGECGWEVLETLLHLHGFIGTRSRIYSHVKQSTKISLNRDRLSAAEMLLALTAFDMPTTMVVDEGKQVFYTRDGCGRESLYPIYLVGGHWSLSGKTLTNVRGINTVDSGDQLFGESSSSDYQPRSIVERYSYMTRCLMKWEHQLVSTEEVVAEHKKVYPNRGVPRFLMEKLPNNSHVDITPVYDTISVGELVNSVKEVLPNELNDKVNDILAGKRRASVSWLMTTYFENEIDPKSYYYREKATSKKHNVLLSDILECGVRTLSNDRMALVFSFVALHTGQALEFVSSVALWLTIASMDELALGALLEEKVLHFDEDSWLEGVKPLHDKWRKYGIKNRSTGVKLADEIWAQMLYMPALYGRGGVEVDWQKEFANKSKEPDNILMFTKLGWSADAAEKEIMVEMDNLVKSAFPQAQPRPFNQFMDMAYEWLVSGSSAGLPSVLKNSPVRDEVLEQYGIQPRPTKRSVMEAIPRSHILEVLKTSPKVISKAHMKLNETGGKARAIYGVSIWHYIFSNWLVAPVETHLKSSFVDINLPNSKFVELLFDRAHSAKQGAVFSSYDYPDFNSMHSHENMANLYRSIKNHGLATLTNSGLVNSGDLETISAGYDWLIDSTYRQGVIHPITNTILPTVGGLYSGNRDTTLINTLLNVCYSKVVDKSMVSMGLDPGVNKRFCHGDDIITLFVNYPAAMAWNETAEKCRLKGQETKLLTDCSYHEYLRVMGSPNGTLLGCLARSCATFVNGNWESDRTVGLGNKMREMFSNLSTLVRRGADKVVCENLWSIAAVRAADRIKSLKPYKQHLSNMLPLSLPQKQTYLEKHHLKDDVILSAGRKNRDDEISYSKLSSEVTKPYAQKIIKSLPTWASITKGGQDKMLNVLQASTYGTELPAGNQDVGMSISISKIPGMSFMLHERKKSTEKRGCSAVLSKGGDLGFSYSSALRIITDESMNWRIKNRIKALYVVLQHCSLHGGHTKYELIGHLIDKPSHIVREVLNAEGWADSGEEIMDFRDVPEVASALRQFRWSYGLLTHTDLGLVEGFKHTSEEGHTLASRNVFKY